VRNQRKETVAMKKKTIEERIEGLAKAVNFVLTDLPDPPDYDFDRIVKGISGKDPAALRVIKDDIETVIGRWSNYVNEVQAIIDDIDRLADDIELVSE
jgi:hypothetical protein